MLEWLVAFHYYLMFSLIDYLLLIKEVLKGSLFVNPFTDHKNVTTIDKSNLWSLQIICFWFVVFGSHLGAIGHLLRIPLMSYYDRNRNLLVSFVSADINCVAFPYRSRFKKDGSARHPNEPFSVPSSGMRRVPNSIQVDDGRVSSQADRR